MGQSLTDRCDALQQQSDDTEEVYVSVINSELGEHGSGARVQPLVRAEILQSAVETETQLSFRRSNTRVHLQESKTLNRPIILQYLYLTQLLSAAIESRSLLLRAFECIRHVLITNRDTF